MSGKSKVQRLADAWIPIEKRIPTNEPQIIYWVPEQNEVFVGKGINLHQAAIAMLDPERRKFVAWDKRLSHWVKVVPPHDKN